MSQSFNWISSSIVVHKWFFNCVSWINFRNFWIMQMIHYHHICNKYIHWSPATADKFESMEFTIIWIDGSLLNSWLWKWHWRKNVMSYAKKIEQKYKISSTENWNWNILSSSSADFDFIVMNCLDLYMH